MKQANYKAAGVDIDAGDLSVKRIAKIAKSTFNQNVISDIGLFGSFYKIDFSKYKKPILVSSVDGVGTKLKIAFMTGIHNTVGEDLVNHCVNDIMTSGATPLFFLDYLAVAKLEPDVVVGIVEGMARGCRNAGCALIGGETAEMPDFYAKSEYDMSGTIVGIIDGEHIIDGSKIKKGDILIALPSNGLHTNGFSLVRKIFFDLNNLSVDQYVEELGSTLADELLKVHKSYKNSIELLMDSQLLHGMSHITGGGIEGNTKRIVPSGNKIRIDWSSWELPEIFKLIQKLGNVSDEEMRHVFNLGVGFIFIIDKNNVDKAVNLLKNLNEQPFIIGEIS